MSDSDPDFDALYNEKQKIYEQVTERILSDFQRLAGLYLIKIIDIFAPPPSF